MLKYILPFFAKDFKKRFISIIMIPLVFSGFFLIDFFLLPEIIEADNISQIQIIKISSSAGGTSTRSSRRVGYKYFTIKNHKFSTSARRAIKSYEIDLTISPVFKTVKTVIINNKNIDIVTGLKGVKGVMLVLCNSVIIISIFFAFIIRNITANIRQNLIFLNIFLFLIWVYILALF